MLKGKLREESRGVENLAHWKNVLELNSKREVTAGNFTALQEAVRAGADLRVYTEFRHNEHIEPASDNPEIIQEVSEFRATYLLDNRWTAGIMTLRQPVDLPGGFGPRPSMSFFLYNQDGRQAIARPFLDGVKTAGVIGPSPLGDFTNMPKYHQFDNWDAGTNAPSHNFIYDFEVYRFQVRNNWQEVFSHDEQGRVISGSLKELISAFTRGCEVKVGISGLCRGLAENPGKAIPHELFIQTGYGYYYTETRLFIAETHPLVRVKPAVPLAYESKGWDFGWAIPRTDGFVALLFYCPYTLTPVRTSGRYPIRWFIR